MFTYIVSFLNFKTNHSIEFLTNVHILKFIFICLFLSNSFSKEQTTDAKILQHLEEMKKEISIQFNQQYQDLKLRIDDLKKENKQLKESKMDFRTLKFVVTYFWALIGYKLKQHMRLEKDKKIPIHDFQKLSEEVKELYKKIKSIENIVKPAIKENNNKQNCEKINRKNKPEKKNDKLSAVV